MIKGSIDVTKIDKERLYEGKKGKYLNIVLIETPDSKYGQDYMIKQDGEKGEETAILGNAKIFSASKPKEAPPAPEPIDDDLPF